MSFVGDLERAFAAALYPNRIPIAIALGVGLILVLGYARRRGWLAAARRRPWRAAAVAAVALAILGPAGWYLGSPLFIRTALVEPAPSGGVIPSPPGAPGSSAGPSPSVPSAAPAETAGDPPATAAASGPPTLSGTFRGEDEFHFGRGTATLIQVGPDQWTVRFEDFSVRNGPDLYVYLSPDPAGYATGALELGRLRATDGSFNTPVPAGTDVSRVRSVVIWCRQFSVQFAVARLS